MNFICSCIHCHHFLYSWLLHIAYDVSEFVKGYVLVCVNLRKIISIGYFNCYMDKMESLFL